MLPARAVCERIGEQSSDAPALAWQGQLVTLGALRARAAGIAKKLRGELIAVSLERGPDLVAALLACWHAGAAYVPVDPSYPEERRRYMLQDARASVVIDEAFVAGCGEGEWRPTPGELAYVLYTSGSTGRPKGVEITHGALAHFLAAMQQTVGIRPGERIWAHTPLSFDIAGLELFWPLVEGGTIVMASREDARLGRVGAVDLIQGTPSTFRLLDQARFRPAHPVRLLCGGEAWSTTLLPMLHAWGREVWNVYGPTEATIWASAHRIDDAVRIGAPLPGMRFAIEDDELLICGPCLARGYLRQPQLTAERFIIRDGERWYRTGDRVRLDGDLLDYQGRLDRQVKVRGFRIELGELEESALRLVAVREAAAVAVAHDETQRVVLYLVGEQADVRVALAGELPDYMLPWRIVWLDALPLLPNGKVDRGALAQMAGGV